MKQIVLIVGFIAISMVACRKYVKNSANNKAVNEYVTTLKSDSYPKYNVIPKFSANDIDALLKYADNKQLIENYPIPSFSAAYYGPQEVGMIILYTVESIRLQREYGASNRPYAVDKTMPEVKLSSTTLAPYYTAWWEKNKGKTADELKVISPLAQTNFSW